MINQIFQAIGLLVVTMYVTGFILISIFGGYFKIYFKVNYSSIKGLYKAIKNLYK